MRQIIILLRCDDECIHDARPLWRLPFLKHFGWCCNHSIRKRSFFVLVTFHSETLTLIRHLYFWISPEIDLAIYGHKVWLAKIQFCEFWQGEILTNQSTSFKANNLLGFIRMNSAIWLIGYHLAEIQNFASPEFNFGELKF